MIGFRSNCSMQYFNKIFVAVSVGNRIKYKCYSVVLRGLFLVADTAAETDIGTGNVEVGMRNATHFIQYVF